MTELEVPTAHIDLAIEQLDKSEPLLARNILERARALRRTTPDRIDLQSMEQVRARIQRDIDWYEAKGKAMKSSEYQLALAVVIGATKALTELLRRLPHPQGAK